MVSSIDEDVCVEYGADLHTMDHGSGFPTAQSKNLSPEDQVLASAVSPAACMVGERACGGPLNTASRYRFYYLGGHSAGRFEMVLTG